MIVATLGFAPAYGEEEHQHDGKEHDGSSTTCTMKEGGDWNNVSKIMKSQTAP